MRQDGDRFAGAGHGGVHDERERTYRQTAPRASVTRAADLGISDQGNHVAENMIGHSVAQVEWIVG